MPAFPQNFMKSLPPPDRLSGQTPVLDAEGGAARTLAEEGGRQAIGCIGIAGFSAGGGVVMGAVMQHDEQSRPDFAAPIYAA